MDTVKIYAIKNGQLTCGIETFRPHTEAIAKLWLRGNIKPYRPFIFGKHGMIKTIILLLYSGIIITLITGMC